MSQQEAPSSFMVPATIQGVFEELKTEDQRLSRERDFSRPSPFSAMRLALETQIQSGDFGSKDKELVIRAFEILLSIEQRTARIEEFLLKRERGEKTPLFQWLSVKLSGEACVLQLSDRPRFKVGALFWLDFLLPSVPEYRIRCIAELASQVECDYQLVFRQIHPEDQEQIYRFVRQREREIIRQKSPRV
ncbi:MAG: hypothetical protein EA369_03925 [Bradymonadales bacterium]|nr:MAG: hypothetical protein EA369_03925 [Bradymonadales bacterium]